MKAKKRFSIWKIKGYFILCLGSSFNWGFVGLSERRKWGGLIELYCIPLKTDVDRAYVPISFTG